MSREKTTKIVERSLRWLIYGVMVVYCLSLFVPIIWMINTAFKGYIEYYENPFLFPNDWTIANFPSAFEKIKMDFTRNNAIVRYGIFDMLGISFIWAFSVSFLHVVMTTGVAYVLSRYKFFGCNFLYMLGIFVMVTPIIGNAPSMMTVKRDLGIFNNLGLTILTQNSTAFSGLHFMIMYAAFKRIPASYSEAAQIDGAGHWAILLKIMVPMMLPTCGVLMILSFITHWNEYGHFLIWLPSYPNLAYGMYTFQKDAAFYGATINEIMAGFIIAIIPSMTLYLSSQKLITSKFTVGGLKG